MASKILQKGKDVNDIPQDDEDAKAILPDDEAMDIYFELSSTNENKENKRDAVNPKCADIENYNPSPNDGVEDYLVDDSYLKLLELKVENQLFEDSCENKRRIRQKYRNSGQSYETVSGKVIKDRICEPFDSCRQRCEEKINYESCKKIFNNYWCLGSYNRRSHYIRSLMQIKGKKNNTLAKSSVRQRERDNTVVYFLKFERRKIKVCRRHFTQCFGETSSFVRSNINKKIALQAIQMTKGLGKSASANKVKTERKNSRKAASTKNVKAGRKKSKKTVSIKKANKPETECNSKAASTENAKYERQNSRREASAKQVKAKRENSRKAVSAKTSSTSKISVKKENDVKPPTMKAEIKSHINKFPAYESQYTCIDTSLKYLHADLTLKKMYQLYTEQVPNPGKYSTYCKVFYSMNLKFKSPYMSSCSTCESLQAQIKMASGQENRNLLQSRRRHIQEAEIVYKEKTAEKVSAQKNKNTKVFTFDLQQCLPTPFLRNQICFYKRPLWTYNFTVHDLGNDIVQCFMWHETVANRGGNEIASCIYRQLQMVDKMVTRMCFYSDSSTVQNKNSNMTGMFIKFVHNSPHIEYIDHKFLEPGHTYMECDSDFALIEFKTQETNVEIQVPRDWYQFVRSIDSKMHVVEMKANNFFDFSKLLKTQFVYRPCNEDGDQFIWKEVRWIRYTKDISCFYYKTSLDVNEPFKVIKSVKGEATSKTDLPVVETIRAISVEKKQDLLDMLSFIDPEFHSFYKNLHASALPNIHPDLIDEEEIGDEEEQESRHVQTRKSQRKRPEKT
ncbi:uncharacterized protein [Eurosta solidaginis]|uniref:uncharacterized protein n=1 Tax=Eurosta solidaginis TaxID=178769 RepID=UPI00353116B0